jgi:SAM-dependent methyltransferase
VEHEHVAGVLRRPLRAPTRAFYRDIARLSNLPADTSVLDIPCGSGVVFRGLRAEQKLDYVAADVDALPFEDRSFGLVVTLTGVHCFPDPAAAITEMSRVLRRGGELRGTSVIKRTGLRQDAAVRPEPMSRARSPGCRPSAPRTTWRCPITSGVLLVSSTRRDASSTNCRMSLMSPTLGPR